MLTIVDPAIESVQGFEITVATEATNPQATEAEGGGAQSMLSDDDNECLC